MEISESVMRLESVQRGRGEHPYFKHPKWADLPEVYFENGITGYELGLEAQHDWWKQLCESGELGELAKTKSDPDYRCGTVKLVVATLPYSEFGVYYEAFEYDRMLERQAARNKQLAASGWTRKDDDHGAEIQDPWSRLEHKYFSVSHRDV